MKYIRKAEKSDISRIAEMIVFNYRMNFYKFFKNDPFYFGELNVLDTAGEISGELKNYFVYDDGVVKGFIKVNDDELEKLHVEAEFQSKGIGAELLRYAVDVMGITWLWVLEYNERGAAFYKRNGFEFTGEKMIEYDFVPLLKMSKSKGE